MIATASFTLQNTSFVVGPWAALGPTMFFAYRYLSSSILGSGLAGLGWLWMCRDLEICSFNGPGLTLVLCSVSSTDLWWGVVLDETRSPSSKLAGSEWLSGSSRVFLGSDQRDGSGTGQHLRHTAPTGSQTHGVPALRGMAEGPGTRTQAWGKVQCGAMNMTPLSNGRNFLSQAQVLSPYSILRAKPRGPQEQKWPAPLSPPPTLQDAVLAGMVLDVF